jgi:hypothetical protein
MRWLVNNAFQFYNKGEKMPDVLFILTKEDGSRGEENEKWMLY